MTSYLFLAPAVAPFGEAVMGRDLASAAHAAGHDVTFLHTRAVARVFEGAAFRRGIIDDVLPMLPDTVLGELRAQRVDVLVLVDAISTYGVLGARIRTLVASSSAKVVALDLWGLRETSLECDLGETTTRLDPVLAALPLLRPAPVARPDALGAYRALPVLGPQDRAATRARLGIGETERVVFTASGTWQSARNFPPDRSMHRLAAAWPAALSLVLRRLEDVRVVHVGPEPFALAGRYLHVPQVSPAEFQQLLAASDVAIGNNVIATSIATALALDVPPVVIDGAQRLDEPSLELPDDVRAWLASVVPLYPYAVLPIGLRRFVAPIMAGNPYADAIDRHDVLAPDATAARIRQLLEGDPAKQRARESYRARIAALPAGLDMLAQLP